MWARLGKAALVALAVVVIAELSARTWISQINFPHSYDVPRNPNFLRAWPNFTEPRDRGPDDRLVILISNSQGYAPELEDGAQCYASRLQSNLNERDPARRHIVANWSIAGASGAEMLLLAARAAEHEPDLLLIVTHSNPYSVTRARLDLPFLISDANQLICDDSINRRMPRWFRKRHGAITPGLFLESHCGLVKLRNIYIEQRDKRWDPRERVTQAPARPQRSLPRAPNVEQKGEALFEATISAFHEPLPETPVLIVNMPLCRSKWHRKSWPILQGFGEQMRGVIDEGFPGTDRITVIDAIDVIDESRFLTQAHLDPQGHARFADYLTPLITERLKTPPRQAQVRTPKADP